MNIGSRPTAEVSLFDPTHVTSLRVSSHIDGCENAKHQLFQGNPAENIAGSVLTLRHPNELPLSLFPRACDGARAPLPCSAGYRCRLILTTRGRRVKYINSKPPRRYHDDVIVTSSGARSRIATDRDEIMTS
ncbi:hypothetical protein EVAR_92379_1 [Eumeta japonica]|uniref:Uncharacterized protein n=1 Tax=Eumeta variegata TaxID=151549 RepID=A0A4C1TLX9_EUMVA|nr:hypothetical protein EVAR_92379_1 [Eumeta japonica]